MDMLRLFVNRVQKVFGGIHCYDWFGNSKPSQHCHATTKSRLSRDRWRRSLPRTASATALLVLSLTGLLGHRFYHTPKLAIDTAAPQTLYAPATTTIEDKKATEEKRRAIRRDFLVWMNDSEATQRSQDALRDRLQQGTELRRSAGALPYTSTAILSTDTQAYLRRADDAEWQSLRQVLESQLNLSGIVSKNFAKAISELRRYQQTAGTGASLELLQTINDARLRYGLATAALPLDPIDPLKQAFDTSLLDIADTSWEKTQTSVLRVADRMLSQGIPPGLPESLLEQAIDRHLETEVPETVRPTLTKMLLASLQPNLTRDEAQTQLQAAQAAQELEPVVIPVRKGDVLIRSGTTISAQDFIVLDHFGLSRREVNWAGLLAFGCLVSGALAIVWWIKRRFHPGLRRRDGLLLWLLSLSVPLLILLKLPSTNLPAVGVLVGSFYGAPLGIALPGLLGALIAIGLERSWLYILPSLVGGVVCGWLAGRLRSREGLALLGVAVGLLQGTLYLLLHLPVEPSWYILLTSSALQILVGLIWIIVAIGTSPYLEQLFDLVTTTRLVELANPNCPLLKRLAAETPGTFQHTLFVASLAEAAAQALGCNVELVRAGTLYHDIGKMHDPQGFIENQMGGTNKHDLMNDPWHSADIIKKHVSEGLVMARRFRLPKAVQAFIPEHQGTMLIAYFYHQAVQQAAANSEGERIVANEADFRYAGPIPQSRETGIVMLADSCEAALRSLKDATCEEAHAMVNKILRARWQDNQLIDSGLTRDEMTLIAEIFVRVWQQFNHQRIAYPKPVFPPTVAAVQG